MAQRKLEIVPRMILRYDFRQLFFTKRILSQMQTGLIRKSVSISIFFFPLFFRRGWHYPKFEFWAQMQKFYLAVEIGPLRRLVRCLFSPIDPTSRSQ
jgi:hypothetical protein